MNTHEYNHGLSSVLDRITKKLETDSKVYHTVHALRQSLGVDRVVLYYFYTQWRGQVTFEAISDRKYSIICSTGVDDCFNEGYAELYLKGRIHAIDDVLLSPISDCHRQFLIDIQVRSNLVAPVLSQGNLWGLLIAHHCQNVRTWGAADLQAIAASAESLAQETVICN
jgi:GAF domain-containing protein